MNRTLAITNSPWSCVLAMVLKRKELPFNTKIAEDSLIPIYDDGYIHIADPITTLDYLEDRHPEPRVFPTDPGAKAYVRYLIRFFERTTPEETMLWIVDELRQVTPARLTYGPSDKPTVLDFYIAAFSEKLHSLCPTLTPWATLPPLYLGASTCAAYFLRKQGTDGEHDCILAERSITAVITPPRLRP